MTKKLTPYTLPISGTVVQTVPISMTAITMQLKRKSPAPKPPLVRVEIAGVPTAERNYADPDFIAGRQTWENMINFEGTEQLLKRLAMVQVLTDDQTAEVAELREALGEDALDPDDRFVWLTEIAPAGDKDIQALVRFATGQADPTEEGVNGTADSFRGDVPGA